MCNELRPELETRVVHLFDFKTTGCSGWLKFSERFEPALCTYLILKTMGCSSCLKFSESKNRWFQFFEGEKKKQNQRIVHFGYFRNITESTVFMEELSKNWWLGRKFFEFFKNGNSI